jgi:anti-sigma factor RsiW
MTCREVIEFLMSYLDGELPPEVCAEFERHLAVCSSCVAYLESYRQTIAISQSGGATTETSDPQELPAELVAAIQNALRPN